MPYDKSKDMGAQFRGSVNDSASQINKGNSLQAAATAMTSRGEHTAAPNVLPAPTATAGHTMGSKPGPKNPSSPGIRQTGVGRR